MAKFKLMTDKKYFDYVNSSNFIANNTKPQSNYMNPRGITNDKS